MKSIAILGSTGSIGTQALEVIEANPQLFRVVVLTARNNWEELARQALKFTPQAVVISNHSYYSALKEALAHTEIQVKSGEEALGEVVQYATVNLVLTATVGYSGLIPTIAAIQAGKDIALANKETLVVAGQLITDLLEKHKVKMLPVDSEHSAIYQCLVGEETNEISRLILTASGGPFRGKKKPFLQQVTKEQALKHPNWEMGAKITIDSATLMNKGLEVIEAKWLFNVPIEQIDVVVHPQSIIHSLVEFTDTSMKAQLGLPDMRVPIQYALSYPGRLKADFPPFNFLDYPTLTFEKPDTETFRNLALAFEALKRTGNMPCVLNAANEIAVEAFLNDKIGFLEIPDLVEACMAKIEYISTPSLSDYVETDRQTRIIAKELIS
jgi:1-deoxy-D-xylulose-5-phosphate reductoisomerase